MVRVGLELLICDEPAARLVQGRPFALLANQASMTCQWEYAWEVLQHRFPGQLRAVFSPQHGLWCEEQANMITSPHGTLPQTEIPLYSLYSETREPTEEMLADVELLVVDLQDVGTRVYTFAWTLLNCMRVCARLGREVVVCDRPNPIGGAAAEGPLLEPGMESFVGGAPIPLRHGLTLGELARWLHRHFQLDLPLHVVAVQGWRRHDHWDDTRRPWLPPSPNLPTPHSALVYAGQVLLEGTNLSEGRGTTRPFELTGAPFVDPYRWIEAAERYKLPGVKLLPVRFRPTSDKWQGELCRGVFLAVTDRQAFRPVRTTVALLAACCHLWPDHFQWRPPPYEYETQRMPIDLLWGSPLLRQRLQPCHGDLSVEELEELLWLDEPAWWKEANLDMSFG